MAHAVSAPYFYGGAWNLGPWEFHPLSLLFSASGSMMISKTPAHSEALAVNRGRRLL